ncbi:hypothetical protein FACS189499_08530 [Clostridia bacterium]|nr:hypothetical protein FACS189499_08530 [Clostridia bacterium]
MKLHTTNPGYYITAENDPANMGTYNYANPETSPIFHLGLDIAPYNTFGNTRESMGRGLNGLSSAIANAAAHENNEEAKINWNYWNGEINEK